MIKITKRELARLIDHTNLHANATEMELKKLALEANLYKFASVCVYSADVPIVKKYLEETIPICAVIGFPHGKSTTPAKVREALDAIKYGAREIDMVINQGKLIDGKYEEVVRDIREVAKVVHRYNGLLKVICENCNLPTVEIKKLAYKAAHEAEADFIKTSTGFGKYGARIEDVKLMRETLDELGSNMGIKAAGGIHFASREVARKHGKDEPGALDFLEAAGGYKDPLRFRIGASKGVQIVETLEED